MRFENLDIWKLSSELSASVYLELKDLKDNGFKNQITRSCLSVPSNIAEGIERPTEQEKHRFLSIARSSLAEFKTQTYIGLKIGYISEDAANSWINNSEKLAAMLPKFMLRLNSNANFNV